MEPTDRAEQQHQNSTNCATRNYDCSIRLNRLNSRNRSLRNARDSSLHATSPRSTPAHPSAASRSHLRPASLSIDVPAEVLSILTQQSPTTPPISPSHTRHGSVYNSSTGAGRGQPPARTPSSRSRRGSIRGGVRPYRGPGVPSPTSAGGGTIGGPDYVGECECLGNSSLEYVCRCNTIPPRSHEHGRRPSVGDGRGRSGSGRHTEATVAQGQEVVVGGN
jgi:hypothetical protein